MRIKIFKEITAKMLSKVVKTTNPQFQEAQYGFPERKHISLRTNDTKHLFMCLLVIHISPLEKGLLEIFPHS